MSSFIVVYVVMGAAVLRLIEVKISGVVVIGDRVVGKAVIYADVIPFVNLVVRLEFDNGRPSKHDAEHA